MSMPKGLLIFGFGGHARSVADIALSCGIAELCFVDENARDGETFFEFPVKKRWPKSLPDGWLAFPAAGDNLRRQQQCEQISAKGWPLETLIAPSATIGVGSRIEPGSLIAQHVHIGPMAFIGRGCIINTGAVVEHESVVGDYSHISVNSSIAGRSKIGSLVFVGAGATVIDGITLVDDIVLGAGGCAVNDILMAGTYVGVPAKLTIGE